MTHQCKTSRLGTSVVKNPALIDTCFGEYLGYLSHFEKPAHFDAHPVSQTRP
jgi:hypothetical protein